MNAVVDDFDITINGTPALLDNEGKVIIRLMDYTGNVANQPIGLFKTERGYVIHGIYVSNPNSHSTDINRYLTALSGLMLSEFGKLLDLVTWTDSLKGFSVSSTLITYYLGKISIAEGQPKLGNVQCLIPGLFSAVHTQKLLSDLKALQPCVPKPHDPDLIIGNVLKCSISSSGLVSDLIGSPDEAVGLIIDINPGLTNSTDEFVKQVIISVLRKLPKRIVMLKNIYLTNYMSNRVLTSSFYDVLALIINPKG